MRRFWFLLASAASLTAFGGCPNASAESCLHGIYIDFEDGGRPYACPWGGGMIHTTHGDVYVDVGGQVLPDSAYAYGLPDDGGGDDDGENGDESADSGE